MGVREKKPFGLDRFIRAAKKKILLFALCYGDQHKPDRLDALSAMGNLRDAHLELFTAHKLVKTRWAMNFNYIAEIEEGTRRASIILPCPMGEIDSRRYALAPIPTGRPSRGYPETWKVTNEAGYWRPTAIPKLEEKDPRGA